MLTFEESTHTYRYNGRVVPGVTSVLSPISDYSGVPAHALEAASLRGQAVHLACQFYDEGDLYEEGLDPVLAPYLSAWAQFRHDHDCNWFEIEKPRYCSRMGFAGTPDRVGTIDDEPAILDIKTTASPMPAVGPQLAAYEMLAYDTANVYCRYAVYLKPDGTYLLKRYQNPSDISVFASLLTLRTWCQAQKVTLSTPNWK